MSGEFRWVGSNHFHSVLEDISEVGQEELSRVLYELYKALLPLERACAWVEAGDSSPSACVIAAVNEGVMVINRCEQLVDYIQRVQKLSRDLIADKVRREGFPKLEQTS